MPCAAETKYWSNTLLTAICVPSTVTAELLAPLYLFAIKRIASDPSAQIHNSAGLSRFGTAYYDQHRRWTFGNLDYSSAKNDSAECTYPLHPGLQGVHYYRHVSLVSQSWRRLVHTRPTTSDSIAQSVESSTLEDEHTFRAALTS